MAFQNRGIDKEHMMGENMKCLAIDRARDKDAVKYVDGVEIYSSNYFTNFTDTKYECELIDGKLIIPEGVKNLAGFSVDESFSKVDTILFPASLESIENLSLYPNENYNYGLIDNNIYSVEMLGDERNVRMHGGLFKDYKHLYQNEMLIIGRVLIDCSKTLESIVVPDAVEVIGRGCFSNGNAITEISLPESLRVIRRNAFSNCKRLSKVSFRGESSLEVIEIGAFANCPVLKSFSIPSTVKEIGASAFKNSPVIKSELKNLSSIGKDAFYGERNSEKFVFPDVLIQAYGGEKALKEYLGITNEEGLLIRDDSLILAYHDSATIIISDDVRTIDENFEIRRGNTENALVKIVLPKSLKVINGDKALLAKNVSIELPREYLRQKNSLSADIVYKYLSSSSADQLTLEDYISLFLLQNKKKINPICMPYLLKDCNETVDCMISVLMDRGSQKGYNAANAFIIDNQQEISPDRVSAFYRLCKKNKKTKIIEELERIFGGMHGPDSEVDPLESECRKKYKEDSIEQILKKATISTNKAFKKSPVLYKSSRKPVPEYVVKVVLALYMNPMLSTTQPKFISAADDLAELFDKVSLNRFMRIVGERVFNKFKEDDYYCGIYGVQKFDLMIPMLCRLMDETTVTACIEQYEKNGLYISNYNDWDYKKKKDNIDAYNDILLDGIIMSDSVAAVEFCRRKGIIDRYALFRGKAASDYEKCIGEDVKESEDDLRITKAIVIYDEILKKMDKLMDGYYNYPTVMACYGIGSISKDNSLAERFFGNLFQRYKNLDPGTSFYNDYMYEPKQLYKLWRSNHTVCEGQIGLCFTIGLAVAYYMFESSDIEAEIVYCRDKWEYRGDYSSATRAVLKISPEVKNWNAYNRKGYPVREM